MMRIVGFCFMFIVAMPLAYSQESSTVTLDVKPVPQPIWRDSTVDRWNKSFPAYYKLPKEAQELLYWTNLSRINPRRFWDSVVAPIIKTFPNLDGSYAVSLRTTLYNTEPLPLFRLNDTLIRLAQGHALDISGKKAKTGHNSSNGETFSNRIKKSGIRYCSAENTSLSGLGVVMAINLLYLDIGLPNLGHRNTLLNPNYTEIGIGSAKYSSTHYFLVQDFACAQSR
jgi:hypothetical protein